MNDTSENDRESRRLRQRKARVVPPCVVVQHEAPFVSRWWCPDLAVQRPGRLKRPGRFAVCPAKLGHHPHGFIARLPVRLALFGRFERQCEPGTVLRRRVFVTL